MVSEKKFLWEFPIGSYVKLSSAVAAILVEVLKCRTQFWKRTTQESFQQSLVEIGSVVSEEKIFKKFHPSFLAHLTFRPCELLSSLFVIRPSSVVRPSTFHIVIFSSETTGPIATKHWWNGPWMAPFQNCVR